MREGDSMVTTAGEAVAGSSSEASSSLRVSHFSFKAREKGVEALRPSALPPWAAHLQDLQGDARVFAFSGASKQEGKGGDGGMRAYGTSV